MTKLTTIFLLMLTVSHQVELQCTTGRGCGEREIPFGSGSFEDLLQEISGIRKDVTSLLQCPCRQRKHGSGDIPQDEDQSQFPRDCADVYKSGEVESGVYTVYTFAAGNPVPFQVWCDMETTGGGWMVFQRRMDGSVDFYKPWNQYADGFGNISGEYWLGNLILHALTDYKPHELRVDLEDHEGVAAYAQYGNFAVASQIDKFAINVSTYSGDAGDSLARQNGQKFSTKDQDNDIYSSLNCAIKYHGAWWYKSCHSSNLNGQYRQTGEHNTTSYADTVNWYHFRGHRYSIKFTEMKIRPLDF